MVIENGIQGKIISSMEKILPYVDLVEEETRSSVLLGHSHNVQLAFRSEKTMYTIPETQVRISGELEKYITLYEEKFVPAGTYAPWIDDYYIGKEHNLIPDPLKPFGKYGISLPYMQWRSVWVSFNIPENIELGEYETKFELLTNEGEVMLSMIYTLEVIGVRAEKHNLFTTNWMHYDCISQKHAVELFSESFYQVFSNYLKEYVDIGFSALLTPLFTPPLDTAIGEERQTAQLIEVSVWNGEYSFDFNKLKKFLDFVFSHGIKYIEFSHLFTQWGGKATPKINALVDGEEKRIFGWDVPSDSVEYERFLASFLPNLVAFIKDMGIENRCFLHLTDEPNQEHLATYEKCRAIVKKYAKDIPIMDALSHVEFYELGIVDIPVVLLNHYKEFSEKNVEYLFVYNCCGPSNEYYSNRFINMPGQRLRVLGLQMYQTGVKGYLHWGYNFYRSRLSYEEINPYSDTDANAAYPSGDGFIVYPEKWGVVPSVRSKLVKESFQDYEILNLLESYIGRKAVLGLLEEYGFKGYTEYPHSAKAHRELIEKIKDLIKKHL